MKQVNKHLKYRNQISHFGYKTFCKELGRTVILVAFSGGTDHDRYVGPHPMADAWRTWFLWVSASILFKGKKHFTPQFCFEQRIELRCHITLHNFTGVIFKYETDSYNKKYIHELVGTYSITLLRQTVYLKLWYDSISFHSIIYKKQFSGSWSHVLGCVTSISASFHNLV